MPKTSAVRILNTSNFISSSTIIVVYSVMFTSSRDVVFRSFWSKVGFSIEKDKMQAIKVEHTDPNKIMTPEKRAQNREKQLLTYVVKATARDQEKNILISKLHRELSKAVENLDALQAEVMLKDKILHAKEDELLTMKSENEALKQQLQLLLTKRTFDKTPLKPANNNVGVKKNDNDVVKLNNFKTPLKPINNVGLKDNKSPDVVPSTPTPIVSRKRSLKKPNTPKDNMSSLFYNLRKKSKK